MKISQFTITTSLLFFTFCTFAQVQETKTANLMGSVFQITLVDSDSISAQENIQKTISEIERIENLISEWRPETQISQVNQNAGIKPVQVDKEVFELTKKAIWFSEISNGAFDISIVAMDKIWKFDGTMAKLPSKKAIRNSIVNVNYKNIVLDSINSTIFLSKKGMKIGFGSIGKGYAADKARKLLQESGIKAGIINAAGDIATWGTQINGNPWRIGVNNPLETGETIEILEFSDNNAVTTSGNYEKYVEINNKRYSHIINPKTGYPSTELISVTIIGPNAEMCNGFSTSIMVLGLKKGIKLINKFPDYQYIILTNKEDIIKK
ncbi:FAD:protein FMN transferase [Flavobacterium hiemivividum]|uniref:FAD:protein FMN transferase n=1 Tax=Flavobacterium hiemivividum TaxID=2541734 RepID=A0A4R5CMM3_9FLAO|nr:FAD:protein FMN transferase [Flavobacterium hiemivividum]TDE01256.1 FAD:protein FMN transferase [Flavobacterium hiemivividum]